MTSKTNNYRRTIRRSRQLARSLACYLVCCVLLANKKITALTLESVLNLRPVATTSTSSSSTLAQQRLYRSATLDNLSKEDATKLLESYSRITILDLRNSDEIDKGAKQRTEGARFFYDSLDDNGGSRCHQLVRIPILANVDAFWDAAIDRMPVTDRMGATLQTAFRAGALDRAAARYLEQGGLPALYSVMLETCGTPLQQALNACAERVVEDDHDNPLVLFHCQKGKDRTGILAMLLQHCMGETAEDLIRSYGRSGDLLGESPSSPSSSSSATNEQTGLVDWSHFRGSPETAMAETLAWVNQSYGSVDGYLDRISFSNEKRQLLR